MVEGTGGHGPVGTLKLSPTRERILALVDRRPRTVCETARLLGISKSAIHRHLMRLNQDGFLVRVESGKWVYYHAARPETAAHVASARASGRGLERAPGIEEAVTGTGVPAPRLEVPGRAPQEPPHRF